MANRKISDLTALTAPAAGDLLPIVDISEALAADKNKRITLGTLLSGAPLGSAAAPTFAFSGDPNTGIYSPGADQLAIATGGTARITVDGSGNVNIDSDTLYVDAVNNRVGIGTSSPTAIFHAVASSSSGTTNADGIRINAGGNVAINMGANSSVGYGWIQSANWGSGYVVTAINPNGGNVGIGTTSPGGTVDIKAAASTAPLIVQGPSTEFARIDSSGNVGIGATPVAWGANFKALQLGPWTSLVGNNNNGALHLTCNAYYAGSGGGTLTYIGTGAATSYTQLPGSHFWSIASSGTAGTAITFTQAMTLDSSGIWYVGTSTDGGAGGLTIYPAGSGAGSAAIGVWNKTNTALEAAAQFRVSGTTIGSISYSNTLVAYNTTSDYRLKENVTPITNSITRFQQLKPSQFNFIVEPDKTVEGFLAHEAQAVVPECVTGEKDAVDEDGKPVYQGIDQSKLVPLLTAALQEAIARIETLEARLTALEGA